MKLASNDWELNHSFGQTVCSFVVRDNTVAEKLQNLLGTDIAVEVKADKEGRSKDANAYLWVLLGKLASKLRTTPVEVYRQYIRDIGDNYEILPIKDAAVEKFKTIWSSKGYGWICEKHSDSKFRGYTNMICFYGSSTYDTAQMSRMIDMVVEDCKEQGIETLPEEEVKGIMGRWGSDR